jgi:hypothetical protein
MDEPSLDDHALTASFSRFQVDEADFASTLHKNYP